MSSFSIACVELGSASKALRHGPKQPLPITAVHTEPAAHTSQVWTVSVDGLSQKGKRFVSPSARPCYLKLAQANTRESFVHGLFDLMSQHNLAVINPFALIFSKIKWYVSTGGELQRDERHARCVSKITCQIA